MSNQNYMLFPEINEEHAFPHEVNQAIANAPELEEKFLLKSEVPDPGSQHIIKIDGGSP